MRAPIGFRPRSDRRPRAQVGVGRNRVALPRIVPGLGERSLGTDLPLSLVSPSRPAELGVPIFPRWGAPERGGPGAVRASRSLSRAGAGAEPSCRWGPPQGRGSGPTLRGVSLAVPPAPPAASAAARRSSAAFSAQSVSRRCWVSGGRSSRGRGCGEGSPGVRNPRPGLPSPLLPVPGGIPPTRGAASPGLPRGNRAALSRVLTAEWPAPGSRAPSVPGAPSRRDLAPSAGRMEAGAQGRSRGRFGGDAWAGFSDPAVRFLLFWAPGVFGEKRDPSSS